jgi:hypothetical protein
MLIKEAERLGYKNGNFKCLDDGRIMGDDFKGDYSYTLNGNLNFLWLQYSGTLFSNGKWAEIIPEVPSYTMAEAILKIGHDFKIKE